MDMTDSANLQKSCAINNQSNSILPFPTDPLIPMADEKRSKRELKAAKHHPKSSSKGKSKAKEEEEDFIGDEADEVPGESLESLTEEINVLKAGKAKPKPKPKEKEGEKEGEGKKTVTKSKYILFVGSSFPLPFLPSFHFVSLKLNTASFW